MERGLTVLQPLWRNAGRLVARENLTQAERDTVYDVRSFARFRKTFVFEITSSYYNVLRQRDNVTNAWQNYKDVQLTVQRTESEAAAGRRPEFEVDQARQNALRARDSWVQALRRYAERLDRFKVSLALPADGKTAKNNVKLFAGDRLRQLLRILFLLREMGQKIQNRKDRIVLLFPNVDLDAAAVSKDHHATFTVLHRLILIVDHFRTIPPGKRVHALLRRAFTRHGPHLS